MKNDIKKLPHVAAGLAVEIDALVERGIIKIGAFYTVESINPIWHGRLVAVTPSFYMLADASWLGDVGMRADYESGAPPAEANYIGGTEENPFMVERSANLGLKLAPIQKALSDKTPESEWRTAGGR